MMLWIGSIMILTPRRLRALAKQAKPELDKSKNTQNHFLDITTLSHFNRTTFVLNQHEHEFSNQLFAQYNKLQDNNKFTTSLISPFYISISQNNQFDMEWYFYRIESIYKIEFLTSDLQYVIFKDKMRINNNYQKNQHLCFCE